MADLIMPRINSVELSGRLTKDPQVSMFQNGNAVFAFTVAQSNYYKSGDEFKEHTVFIRVEYFAPAKSIDRYQTRLYKGAAVYIEGTIDANNWEDKDGNRRSMTYVKAYKVQILSKLEESQASSEPVERNSYAKPANAPRPAAPKKAAQMEDEPDDLDDLPF